MANGESGPTGGPSVGEVGDTVHALVLGVLSFAPAGVQQAFPEGVTESKGLTFLQVFLMTAPWTIAVAIIASVVVADRLPEGLGGLAFIAVVLVGSALLGNALAEESVAAAFEFINEAGSMPWYAYALLAIPWALANYALLYGLPLYIAGLLVGGYAAWVITEKTKLLKA